MHSTSSLFLRKSDAGACSATRFLPLIMGVLKDKTLANFLIVFFVFYFCDFRRRARGAPPPLLSPFLSSREVLGCGSPSALSEKKEKEKGGIIVVATELWPS